MPSSRSPVSKILPEVAHQQVRNTAYLWAIALISLLGLLDAIYLTIQHITGQGVRCTVISGCSEVLSSPYATVQGIPLALIGAGAYFTVFSLAILGAFNYQVAAKLLVPIVGLMFLTTIWLLYLQAFVIKHFCQYCLISAAVTIVLTVLVLVSMRRGKAQAVDLINVE
jgi:uncharacterized membrane protein